MHVPLSRDYLIKYRPFKCNIPQIKEWSIINPLAAAPIQRSIHPILQAEASAANYSDICAKSESNPKCLRVKVWTKNPYSTKIRIATKARICPIAASRSNNLHNPCNTIFCIKTMHSTIKNLFTQFERHIYFTRGGRQKSWRYLLKERYLSALSHFKLTLLTNDSDV